ncbi:hypothetical protein BaRGS_00028874, partial [Batillaria attramentaria]
QRGSAVPQVHTSPYRLELNISPGSSADLRLQQPYPTISHEQRSPPAPITARSFHWSNMRRQPCFTEIKGPSHCRPIDGNERVNYRPINASETKSIRWKMRGRVKGTLG